jgi:hypothetical protein
MNADRNKTADNQSADRILKFPFVEEADTK